MRILNNSKKLKQEYIIKILRLKVMKLLNSTKMLIVFNFFCLYYNVNHLYFILNISCF